MQMTTTHTYSHNLVDSLKDIDHNIKHTEKQIKFARDAGDYDKLKREREYLIGCIVERRSMLSQLSS